MSTGVGWWFQSIKYVHNLGQMILVSTGTRNIIKLFRLVYSEWYICTNLCFEHWLHILQKRFAPWRSGRIVFIETFLIIEMIEVDIVSILYEIFECPHLKFTVSAGP